MMANRKNERMDAICVSDITGQQEELNTVVYNFALSPDRRIREFKRLMEKRFKHVFTEDELQSLLKYKQIEACDLINQIRSYIYKGNHT